VILAWKKTAAEREADDAFYGDPEYKKNKKIVRRRSGGRCEVVKNGRMCGSRDRVQCDHIIPRVQGGTHNLDNLRDACFACHSRKTAQEGKGFRKGGPKRSEDPPLQGRTKW
jgi:5-methylcytosine-specific restriction endonuclease McrA